MSAAGSTSRWTLEPGRKLGTVTAVTAEAPSAHSWGSMSERTAALPVLEQALDAVGPGASFAEVRVVEAEELRHAAERGRDPDRRLERDLGIAVRVVVDGCWGFACQPLGDRSAARDVAARAVAIAKASSGSAATPFAPEPPAAGSYRTDVLRDPFTVPIAEAERVLEHAVASAGADSRIVAVSAGINAKRQHRWLANSEGSVQDQHLMESGGGVVALAADEHGVQRRSYPNTFHGNTRGAGWEWVDELRLAEQASRVGDEAVALLSAPIAPAGSADVVIGPMQLSLQIHESVGHALELDRILGDERNFAGRSFVTPTSLGELRYGSPAVTITSDPTVAGTRGSFAYDDEGTPARAVDLIESGVLRDFLSHRESAGRIDRASTGAARADGWSAPPVCFSTNVFLQPGVGSLDELLERMGDGYYIDDNRSWSIDSRRWNFQFGTEVAWEVKGGKRGRLLKNFSYGGVTPQFWGSVEAVAGPEEFVNFGFPCGKGEPKQWGFLSHGAAPALVRDLRIGVA